jgi:tRNA(Leu) C34 or U34 (ribose-2'-O)-methylase TrmL
MNQVETAVWGKNKTKEGIAPAVALCNPKFPHNVGAALRACSCFRIKQLWFSGNRVPLKADKDKGYRLPREERMKGYTDVQLRNFDYFFEQFDRNVTPVAVELRRNAELLPHFVHPENPLYVFGPEDGSIDQVMLRHCHRFLVIPTAHCVNLSAAVYLVLYDRLQKRIAAGIDDVHSMDDVLNENRGFIEPDFSDLFENYE